jgi:hypothetical protein
VPGFSGKQITADIGVALVPGVQSWQAEESVQELSGETAQDLGFEHPDFGLQVVSVSLQLVIDITTGLMSPIRAGTTISNLNLFASLTAGRPIFSIPTFRVFKSTPKGEVNGRFTYEVSGKSSGPYSFNDPN